MMVNTRKKFTLSWEVVDDVPEPLWKEARRASGMVPCSVCGHALWSHYQPIQKTCPTIVEDCLGNWWKL